MEYMLNNFNKILEKDLYNTTSSLSSKTDAYKYLWTQVGCTCCGWWET